MPILIKNMKDKYMILVCDILTSQDIAIKLLKSFERGTHPVTTHMGVKLGVLPNYTIKWMLVPQFSDSEVARHYFPSLLLMFLTVKILQSHKSLLLLLHRSLAHLIFAKAMDEQPP